MTHHKHTAKPVRAKLQWWQWVAVGLMMLAIGTYVLTLDDSVVPEVKINVSPPAASAGPGQ